MKPGRPCQHCMAAVGCAIYPDRPEKPCVTFKCAWLREGSPLPEVMRPDRCGAIVMTDRKWHGAAVIMATPVGAEIPEETLEWLKAYSRETDIPLLFRENLSRDGKYNGIRKLGYGPRWFVEAVKNTIEPEDVFRI
ncbi:MAG: hypothetical protein PVJ33_13410 [Lysobacterales bacterium]